MNTPKVSVIVPVYKAEKYLAECIESILRQSFLNFELILVDDGSPDGSGDICKRYAQIDNRLKVIHQNNSGVSAARNAGIAISKGEYIAFIDSDDSVDETFFENAVEAIEQSEADLYISGLMMEFWKDKMKEKIIPYGIQQEVIFTPKTLLEHMEVSYPQICICGPWCKLYKRAIIEEHNIRFEKSLQYGEDTYFNLDVLRVCRLICFSSDIFYHYRRDSEESLFSRFHRDTFEVHQTVYGKMCQLMQESCCDKAAMNRFEGLYFSLLVGGIHEYYKHYHESTVLEKQELVKKVTEDNYVQRTTFRNIRGAKNKVIFLLLRIKCYWLVRLIFYWKYCPNIR